MTWRFLGGSMVLGVLAACTATAEAPTGAEPTPPAADVRDGGAEPSDAASEAAPPALPPGSGVVPTECGATMDWKPFAFDGPEVHVDPAAAAGGDGSATKPIAALQDAIDRAPDGAVLVLAAGRHVAAAAAYEDPTCANCGPGDTSKPKGTVGFVIRKKSLSIRAAEEGTAVLETGAGYGVLVEDACEVHLSGVVVTGGKRDPDGAAADAAVVARRARVHLDKVRIEKNTELRPGREYPGIIGVCARAGGDVLVTESKLWNNSWDGVTTYDDGKVRVFGSTIDKGNGVGVGVTGKGRALVVGTTIKSYWKGIGAFAESDVVATNNVIRDQLGWGIATSGTAKLTFTNNTLVYNDQLAVLAATSASLVMRNNLIAHNGLNRLGGYNPTTFGQGGLRGPAPSAGGAIDAEHNVLFANTPRHWSAASGTSEIEEAAWGPTNRVADPLLESAATPLPKVGSPLIDGGDPAIKDKDGSVSDIGHSGGPAAGQTRP